MNKVIAVAIIASLAIPSLALSETNVNISIGAPAIPVPALPRVVFQAPPLFLAPPALGFYIGVDMPYDMVFISGSYYLFQGNNWYRSSHYNGPWATVRHEHLPQSVRKYKIDRIRHHREHEYRAYQQKREHYSGRHYRPGRDEKEERREHKRYEKEERRYEKNERRYEKEERKHEKEHGGDRDDRQDRGRHRGNKD